MTVTGRQMDIRDDLRDRVTLADVLSRHKRVVIAGGPQTGKTRLAASVTDRPVFHTDDLKSKPWEKIPELVIAQVEGEEAYVLEGVQAGRVLRKGLEPDVVVYLVDPRAPRSKGQQAMAKGCATIFRDWLASRPEVPVHYGLDG